MLQRFLNVFIIIFYISIAFCAGVLLAKNETFEKKIDNALLLLSSSLSNEINRNIEDDIQIWKDDSRKHHDGYVLIGSHYINDPAILLLDSEGKTVRKWNVPKKVANQEVADIHRVLNKGVNEAVFGIDSAEILPDGGIVFSQTIQEYPNYRAQRIAKMDKDGNLVWEIPGYFHHDIYIAEDNNIYSSGSKLVGNIPSIEPVDYKNVLFLKGVVKVVSQDGKLVNEIDIEEAFENSEYKHLLNVFDIDIPPQEFKLRDGKKVYDPIHLNSVEYIGKDQARYFDFINEGDLLISLRGNSSIAVLRPSENKIIWASRGSWKHQHYVRLSDHGTIYIFDNDGGAIIGKPFENKEAGFYRQPRIVEFNPNNNQTKIIYTDNTFKNGYAQSYWRSYYRFLEDNSLIFVSADSGRIMQIDLDSNKKIWELATSKTQNRDNILYTKKLPSVRYYDKKTISRIYD